MPVATEVPEARASTRTSGVFRYRADVAPFSVIVFCFSVQFALYLLASPLVAALATIPLFAVGTMIAAFNHHHQHVNTFNSPVLNRMYELMLAIQTGASPYAWVLHHNLGHHVNYLNQMPHERPDESRWTRDDGTQMGSIEYTFKTLLRYQPDLYRVGRRYPRQWRSYLLMKLPLWGLMFAALAVSPINFLLVFFVPSQLALAYTVFATYEHHAGCPTGGHVEACRNRENRLFNVLTGNLGLHSAHHLRPGLHWSKLPGIHEQIRADIPEGQLETTFFEAG